MAEEGAKAKSEEAAGKKDSGEKKKGKGMKLIIIGVLGIALLGGGGYFAMGMLSSDEGDAAAAKTAKEEKEPLGPAPVYRMKSFIVNLAGGKGRRYLKVTMGLELSDETVQQEIKDRLPQMRDEIITILSSKTYEDIRDAVGKLRLRREIVTRVNRVLPHGKAQRVFFSEFVIQ
ncbi:MAG: flagellar basal body-associated protein FliL [Nitrospinota bacterium]